MSIIKCFLSTKNLKRNACVYIYGAGTCGTNLKKAIENERHDVQILNFVDTYKKGVFDGLKIINLVELDRIYTDKDLIIVASAYHEEITKSLKKHQFSNIAILSPPELYSGISDNDNKTMSWINDEIKNGGINDFKTLEAVYRLKLWSDNGFYHNIPLNDHYSTYSIGEKRDNRPLNFDAWCNTEWDLIYDKIKDVIHNAKVVDVGPVEGYFTLKAAKYASNVTIIHPPHYLLQRLSALAEYFGLSEKIDYLCGLYPETGQGAVNEADIILFLGVLYHIENAQNALDRLTQTNSILIIEGMFFEEGHPVSSEGFSDKFNPAYIDQSPEGDKRLCQFWIEKSLNNSGYSVKWIDDWQKYVEQPGNIRHIGTRRMLIAYPDNK